MSARMRQNIPLDSRWQANTVQARKRAEAAQPSRSMEEIIADKRTNPAAAAWGAKMLAKRGGK